MRSFLSNLFLILAVLMLLGGFIAGIAYAVDTGIQLALLIWVSSFISGCSVLSLSAILSGIDELTESVEEMRRNLSYLHSNKAPVTTMPESDSAFGYTASSLSPKKSPVVPTPQGNSASDCTPTSAPPKEAPVAPTQQSDSAFGYIPK